MPCLCQYFSKDKNSKNTEQSGDRDLDGASSECTVKDITPSEISSSTVATMESKIWSLRSSLTEANLISESMQNVVKSLVSDKYKLLQELNGVKIQSDELRCQCMMERDSQAIERKELMNEIFLLKSMYDEKVDLLESTAKQNVELKLALQEANEKINNMAVMYLSLKSARDSAKH